MRRARVTDAAVAALAGPKLRRLELYWNLRVTDGLLQALARASSRLAVLNLSGCKQVTDAGLAAVARACPRLTHVDLTRCVTPPPCRHSMTFHVLTWLQVKSSHEDQVRMHGPARASRVSISFGA